MSVFLGSVHFCLVDGEIISRIEFPCNLIRHELWRFVPAGKNIFPTVGRERGSDRNRSLPESNLVALTLS